jgi:hypothetical protein
MWSLTSVNERTGRMTRGRTYLSRTRMGDCRCDTVIICKCLVYAHWGLNKLLVNKKSRWGETFCSRLDRPWGLPSLLYNGYRVFLGIKRPGLGADHPPLLVSRSRKSRAIPLPLSGLSGLLRGTFTFTYMFLPWNPLHLLCSWSGHWPPPFLRFP